MTSLSPPARAALAAVALALLAAVAHSPALVAGFTWDDALLLTDNALLRDPGGLRDIWLSAKATDYYPVTWTVLWGAWRVFGEAPAGYHALNLALHIAGALLMWRVLRQLDLPPGAAWLGALLFAVHPVTVASVAWVSQIKNTLSLAPYLAAAWAYLRYDRAPRLNLYLLCLAGFTVALLSKSSTVVLPGVLTLLVLSRHGRITRRHALTLAPLFALALAASVLAIVFQSQQAIVASDPRPEGLASRVAAVGWVVAFYLGKALWPTNLMMVYPRWSVDPASAAAWLPLLLLLGLAGVLAWRRRAWGGAPLLALGCFVASLAPVLGLMDMYYARYSLVSDHLQYLALPVPLALVAAMWARWHDRRPRLLTRLAGGFVVVTLMALSFVHAGTFRDEAAMWAHNLQRHPQSWMAAHGVARALAEQGQLDEAAVLFEQSLRHNPDYERAHVNLGLVRARQGRMDEALSHFQRAADLRPTFPLARWYLGRTLLQLGRGDKALWHLAAATQLKPRDAAIRFELASALQSSGRQSEALSEYQRVLALDAQHDAARYNLAVLLLKLGRPAEAVPHLRMLLQRHPQDDEVRRRLADAEAATPTTPGTPP